VLTCCYCEHDIASALRALLTRPLFGPASMTLNNCATVSKPSHNQFANKSSSAGLRQIARRLHSAAVSSGHFSQSRSAPEFLQIGISRNMKPTSNPHPRLPAERFGSTLLKVSGQEFPASTAPLFLRRCYLLYLQPPPFMISRCCVCPGALSNDQIRPQAPQYFPILTSVAK
jgi:hypothetical protein